MSPTSECLPSIGVPESVPASRQAPWPGPVTARPSGLHSASSAKHCVLQRSFCSGGYGLECGPTGRHCARLWPLPNQLQEANPGYILDVRTRVCHHARTDDDAMHPCSVGAWILLARTHRALRYSARIYITRRVTYVITHRTSTSRQTRACVLRACGPAEAPRQQSSDSGHGRIQRPATGGLGHARAHVAHVRVVTRLLQV